MCIKSVVGTVESPLLATLKPSVVGHFRLVSPRLPPHCLDVVYAGGVQSEYNQVFTEGFEVAEKGSSHSSTVTLLHTQT